jgi:hypothetical protein
LDKILGFLGRSAQSDAEASQARHQRQQRRP